MRSQSSLIRAELRAVRDELDEIAPVADERTSERLRVLVAQIDNIVPSRRAGNAANLRQYQGSRS